MFNSLQRRLAWSMLALGALALVVAAASRPLHTEHSASSAACRFGAVWPACHVTRRRGNLARTSASVNPHRQHLVDGSA